MYVFREARRRVSSQELRQSLIQCLQTLGRQASSFRPNDSVVLEALLRAGELECAVADCTNHAEQQAAEHITDQLAGQLVGYTPADIEQLLRVLQRLPLPPELIVSVPEGFAYYALHPLQYAELAQKIPLTAQRVAVIGIRSIGTTLSATVTAALKKRGVTTERTTVRPEGHPFDRVTTFSSVQRRWIEGHKEHNAEFFVVDEGPGLSGSSLLSVGESLAEASVWHQRITFICARQPNWGTLCSRDVASRAGRFRWSPVPPSSKFPSDAESFIGAGQWREVLGYEKSRWPASWTTMERAKFLSSDGTHFYKFEGFGHYGSAALARACVLGDGGISPQPVEPADGSGYVGYAFTAGRKLAAESASQATLEGIGDYCALRASCFPASSADAARNIDALELMVRTNLAEEFGAEPHSPRYRLELVKPIIVDARMQPWEWTIADDRLIKFDAVSHGDDHFFPGPTDIAWDLAGTIVEFSIAGGNDSAVGQAIIQRYQKQSGDDVRGRLPAYLLAYSAFRLGYCKMAAEAMRGSDEEQRLRNAYLQYRQFAARLQARREAA
jgi:hypothetical protein